MKYASMIPPSTFFSSYFTLKSLFATIETCG